MISKECNVCKKKIEGYTEHQIDHLMRVHKMTKHENGEEQKHE